MKLKFTLILMLTAANVYAGVEALEQAQRMESYGLYSLAKGYYEQTDSKEGLEGRLRANLAQKNSQVVIDLVAANVELLGKEPSALYTALARMQKGENVDLSQLDITQLTSSQVDWARMALGLQAYQKGNMEGAAKIWEKIESSDEAYVYAMALLPAKMEASENPLGKKAKKALTKRIKKLRKDDWDLFKYYIWGVAKTNGKGAARELLEGRMGSFEFGQPQLLMAQLLPQGDTTKYELVLKVLRSAKVDERLRLMALKMAGDDEAISLVDLQKVVGDVAKPDLRAKMRLMLAMAWKARAENAQALKLMEEISAPNLSCDMQAVYYSQVAALANEKQLEKQALAYEKLLELDCISKEQRKSSSVYLADAYYKSGRYEMAGRLYLKNAGEGDASAQSRVYYQAVMAYLEAGKIEEAKGILVNESFGSFPQALLAYLMKGQKQGREVAAMIAPFESKPMSDSERWPIDYLLVRELAAKDAPKAIEKVEEVLKRVPVEFAWRVNFELQYYDLLMATGKEKEATELITQKLIEIQPHPGFIRRGIQEALRTRHFEEALAIINRLTDATAQERAHLLLLALDGMGEREQVEAFSPDIIAAIEKSPEQGRATLTLKLARLWTKVGLLEEAVTLCENLLERDLDDDVRNQTEFLKCSLWELEGKDEAESGLIALSQRPQRATQLAAYARLVGYYMIRGSSDEAMDIFAKEIMGVVEGSEELPPQAAAEVISAVAAVIPHMDEDEGVRLSEWIKKHRTIELN